MKTTLKLFFIVIFVMASSLVAYSQLSLGVKGGMNFATISNYDNIDIPQTAYDIWNGEGNSAYRTGFNAGLSLSYGLGQKGHLTLQLEGLYSNQGMKNSGTIAGISNSSYSTTIETNYLNFPLMFQAYLIPHVFYLEAGPQIGFLLNAKAKYEASVEGFSFDGDHDIKDELNSVDFSVAFGAGFQVPKLPIGVNVRYTLGLTDVTEDDHTNDNDKNVNGVFQLGAFLKF